MDEVVQEHYHYSNIIVVDIKGNVRLAVPDGKEMLGPDAKKLTKEAIGRKKVIFSGLYRSKISNVIRLTLAIPLLVSQGRDNIPIGALLLRIDPHFFLYPLIQSWPVTSQTAETLLVRKEGNDVLFLSELRHRKDTALNFRIPLDGKELPAAMAIKGVQGVVEGKDYRNIPVLAAVRAVPGTQWFIVSKIDKQEVFTPLERRGAFIAIIVSILILSSGLVFLLIWRHQAAESYKRQYEAEHERQMYAQRYEYLTKYANDIILLQIETEISLMSTNALLGTYGYDRNEIVRMNLRDLRSPETKTLLERAVERD